MKYPRFLALLCAWQWCVAASYPQFQCDNGNGLVMAPASSTTFLNRRCDINQCNWKWGKILKDTDDVSTADCEECSEYSKSEQLPSRYTEERPWICPRHCHAMPQINVQVTLEINKKVWIKRLAREGESFQSQYSPYFHRGSTVGDRF